MAQPPAVGIFDKQFFLPGAEQHVALSPKSSRALTGAGAGGVAMAMASGFSGGGVPRSGDGTPKKPQKFSMVMKLVKKWEINYGCGHLKG